jgi:hypothetical protein
MAWSPTKPSRRSSSLADCDRKAVMVSSLAHGTSVLEAQPASSDTTKPDRFVSFQKAKVRGKTLDVSSTPSGVRPIEH